MTQQQIPQACAHGTYHESVDRTLCTYKSTPTWTCCHAHGCAWDEPDNSPEACARRVREMKNERLPD